MNTYLTTNTYIPNLVVVVVGAVEKWKSGKNRCAVRLQACGKPVDKLVYKGATYPHIHNRQFYPQTAPIYPRSIHRFSPTYAHPILFYDSYRCKQLLAWSDKPGRLRILKVLCFGYDLRYHTLEILVIFHDFFDFVTCMYDGRVVFPAEISCYVHQR